MISAADPTALLSTIAQSSAAIVAIVGGFLVSRLVALSSEREGIRRQLTASQDRLDHVRVDYADAHSSRVEHSVSQFTEWVLPDLVDPSHDSTKALLRDNVPRGSSIDEMAPILRELMNRVASAFEQIERRLDAGDTDTLRLEALEARGLNINSADRDVYEAVIKHICETRLPSARSGIDQVILGMPSMPTHPDPNFDTDLRRLDQSLRNEQRLDAERRLLDTETRRLARELEGVGRPSGVLSAVIILAVYSAVGIVVPLVVLAAGPEQLDRWHRGLLLVLFVGGLVAVLTYILWYTRTLDDEFNP